MDFPGEGLWAFRNDTTWGHLNGFDVTTMTTADLDNNGKADLIVSFPATACGCFATTRRGPN